MAWRGRWLALPLSLLVAAAGAAPDLRPDPRAALLQAERERAARGADRLAAEARARVAAEQARRVAAARAAAAVRLRDSGAAATAAAARLQALAGEQAAAEAELAALQARLRPLLPLMQRLALYPAETLLAAPLPAGQAVTGLLVMRGLVGQLRAQADALRLAELRAEAARRSAQAGAVDLRRAQAAQAVEAAALERALAAARSGEAAAEQGAAAAGRAAQAAAAREAGLRGAVAAADADARAAARAAADAQVGRERLAASRRAAPRVSAGVVAPAGPGLAAGSRLAVPVAGPVVRSYGEATEAGPSTGVSYQPAGGARVVSPCAGRLVFGAPFRSFGLLAIVDCGGGWHVVLSGLAALAVAPGAALAAGATLGAMPEGEARLYVELRRNGQPVDPAGRLGG